jgi:hypothetical protein
MPCNTTATEQGAQACEHWRRSGIGRRSLALGRASRRASAPGLQRPRSYMESWPGPSGKIVCSGPKYQYPYASDNLPWITRGYELLGEKYGEIYYERFVLGHDWEPFQALEAKRAGNVVREASRTGPPIARAYVPARSASNGAHGMCSRRRLRAADDRDPASSSLGLIVETASKSAPRVKSPHALLGYAATSDDTQLPRMSRRWGQLHDSHRPLAHSPESRNRTMP